MFFMISLRSSDVRRFIKMNLLVECRPDFKLVLEFWKVCQEPDGINSQENTESLIGF